MKMIYWHIQMNQPWGRKKGKIDSSIMLKESKPVIGTGHWENIQHYYFIGENSNGLKIDDIIFVHEGQKPIAICKVISDSFTDTVLQSKYHHEHYRYVDVISWYHGNEKFPQPQGTLERLINKTITWRFIDNFYKQSKKITKMANLLDLIIYKKQIILQGPPGTGKTREANLIAELLLGLNEIVEIDFFRDILNSVKKIPATNKNNSFYIDSFNNDVINFKESTSYVKFSYSLTDLYECYTTEDYLKEDFVKYPQYSKRCSVLYILDNYKKHILSEQFELIQFHPSYTYEDFVRGIVSKPNANGEGVLFETENKTLGKFAEKALKNLENSFKGITELSLEKWLDEQFDKFIFFISEKLGKEEKIELTESVYIVELDEDAFRYKGLKGWNKKGNRMLFKDIKQAYLDENLERQDIKHNQNLSGLAKWHASYYIRVLDMFKSFLNDEKSIFVANISEKEKLKNYVLIIDEINRANLPSVLGELIYALEYRNKPVNSMYAIDNKKEITLPSNLYIIGTMNTADRSVGHIDYAIKRRFAFVNVLPQIEPVHPLIREEFIKISNLFVKGYDGTETHKTIESSESLASDFKPEDVWIGHSFFICTKENSNENEIDEKAKPLLNMKLQYEIIPLLKEYIKDGILLETEQVKKVMHELISKEF